MTAQRYVATWCHDRRNPSSFCLAFEVAYQDSNWKLICCPTSLSAVTLYINFTKGVNMWLLMQYSNPNTWKDSRLGSFPPSLILRHYHISTRPPQSCTLFIGDR